VTPDAGAQPGGLSPAEAPARANCPATAPRKPAGRLAYLLSFVNIDIYWNNHHHTLAVPCPDAPDPVARCYATRTGWDPRQEAVPHIYLIAIPRTMQALNNLAEITGRTIMRDGQWTSV
jgi:hypothetical protein